MRRRPLVHSGLHQLPDVLGPGETLQRMLAQILQPQAVREMVDHQLRRRLGDVHVAPAGQCSQPRRTVDRHAVVVAVALDSLTGRDRRAHTQRCALWPHLGRQPPLAGHCGSHRVGSPNEHRKRRVALTLSLQQPTTMAADTIRDELVMASQGAVHSRCRALPQRGRTDDVTQ